MLHHDNASSRTAVGTQTFLQEMDICDFKKKVAKEFRNLRWIIVIVINRGIYR